MNRERFPRGKLPQPHKHGCRVIDAPGLIVVTAEEGAGPNCGARSRGGLAELEVACEEWMAEVNTRPHRSTQEPPVIRLAQEHERLHRLPEVPHAVCFGETRKVSWQSTISVGGARQSVPRQLIDERVWARTDGDELIVVHADTPDGPREVARHRLTTPDRPAILDEHYPPRPPGALERRPRARSAEEQAFLAIGPAAEQWLIRAAAAGAYRVRRKMAVRYTRRD